MKNKQTKNKVKKYIHVKTSQNRGVLDKRIRETKVENVELGFWGYVYTYIKPTYVAHLYAYTYTPQNPNLETQKCRKMNKT